MLAPTLFVLACLAFVLWQIPYSERLVRIAIPPAVLVWLIMMIDLFQRSAWRSVVTDRRILFCPRGDEAHLEIMNLDEIAEISRETIVPKLILRGGGRELAIRCDREEADRILAALGRPGWDELPLAGKGQT